MVDHSAHSAPAPESEEEGQQEESQYDKSYEGKLAADLYRDHSSQNKVAIEVFIAAASMGMGYTKEVIDAYNILKKPLDPKKLIDDPVYKRQVARALQLVKRHEGGQLKEKGKSKYKEIVPKTSTALEHANFTHDQQIKTKTNLSKFYAQHLKTVYGLDDKEIASVLQSALARIHENPSLSLQAACRIEIRGIANKKISKEVEKDGVARQKRKEEAEKRLKAKDQAFNTQSSSLNASEQQACGIFSYNGKIEAAKTLGVELKPDTPTSQPPSQPQTAAVPAPSARPVQQPIISKIPFKFSLPSLNLSSIFHPFPSSSLFGKFDSFLKIGTKKINSKILSGITKIGSKIVSKVGSKAIGAAIGQALGSLLPGIGNAAAALLSALGLDDLILRFAFQAALFAVLVVVGVFIGIVFILSDSDNPFSTNTASNPITINTTAQSSTQIYSSIPRRVPTGIPWKEFEEKYLTRTYSP